MGGGSVGGGVGGWGETVVAPLLCLDIHHVYSRSLSQLNNSIRAGSVVEVEEVVPFVGTRASPFDMMLYSIHECWKAVSSFLRHF